ncbi:tail fiber assembly protein [Salmonella enterica subsp. enterica serovar Muenster]|uniref:Phage tail protein n=5 Tax=Enterobacteriaceae TaxID=543 RepID=A0A736HNP7_SALET|nr:tail fiber assembly protein [Salmonella enterica]EAA6743803.1 phage tail protein [Salmonella enterica subsp. enterica serovar Agona]EAM7838922.1 tail fiber assembly protein [Salmonella enterica subsp. enterica]EAP7336846.1 phage tail protein [Salmonella enterica subsp. enterica serovar Orion]EBL3748196.1 tail fiber assembly protein [Salmonella enterica subsp. enterica serovar Typhimurium]EBM0680713.1 tail fiber assembly protein [Salmonella enterica subsp. enterica serovar Enteritidis]EBO24
MYIYDAKTNGFYPVLLKESYELAGTWPKAGVEVTEEEYKALMDGQSTGKVVSANSEGKPVLTDIAIDYVALATIERDRRMAIVTARINELVEAQDDDDITAAELSELIALREYRTKLRRLDLRYAPDVEWPPLPE